MFSLRTFEEVGPFFGQDETRLTPKVFFIMKNQKERIKYRLFEKGR